MLIRDYGKALKQEVGIKDKLMCVCVCVCMCVCVCVCVYTDGASLFSRCMMKITGPYQYFIMQHVKTYQDAFLCSCK